LTQDVTRWRNHNIVCSIFNLKYHGLGGYLIEAINVDRPDQRAYLRLDSVYGMRGKILNHYIDTNLKMLSKFEASDFDNNM
jgi:hypothetical protein